MTNGVFATPKVKVQTILTRNHTRCVGQRESSHIFLHNTTMSEAKEAIIKEDDPEDDDTEELYQSVFIKTEETCPIAR